MYRIDQSKSGSLANDFAVKFVRQIGIAFAIVLVLVCFSVKPGKSVFPILKTAVPGLALVLGYIWFMLRMQKRNYYNSLAFELGSDAISQHVIKEELNLGSKFGMERNKMRYGVDPQQTIKHGDIESIELKNSEIVIKSRSYDFFNGNGRIIIPQETEYFERIKNQIAKLKTDLSLE